MNINMIIISIYTIYFNQIIIYIQIFVWGSIIELLVLVSVGENFIGVNCNGTDLSLDEDLISWKLEVFTGE